MDYVKFALGLVSLAQALLRWRQSSADFTAGEEHQILAASKATMMLTAQGKKIVETIDAMDEGGLDQLERDLDGDAPIAR